METIWKAEPHTIAKITILESYLNAWFQIFGRSRAGEDLIYVDGFAGPGKYSNFPRGSPIAALVAAKSAVSLAGPGWKANDIHCIFVESDKKRFAHLKEYITPFQSNGRIKIHCYESSFVDGLNKFQADMPGVLTKGYPTFVFIDPFGATGIPFDVVEKILNRKNSEVLINFDADGVGRIFAARDNANYMTVLNEVFKKDTWQAKFTGIMKLDRFCREALLLYKENLKSIPNARYVFAFEMRKARSLNYFLVFASLHFLGLEKMKEAMKKVDQSGDYRFSDAAIGQGSLFRFDHPETYATELFQLFTGKRVRYEETRDYALNYTPFTNPKSMLNHLEKEGQINVVTRDPKRRKGTFKEENIEYMEFK